MAHIDNETAQNILTAMAVQRFELKTYSSSKLNAQSNLSGKTHYVDNDTLKYFYSKIVYSNDYESGTIFAIIESCAADYENRNRGFRFVVFDLFGTVLERRNNGDLFKTKANAKKELNAFLDGFNALEHYRVTLTERANLLERQARRFVEIAKQIGA